MKRFQDSKQMEPDYDMKTWAGETSLGRRIFNYNFRMQGREVEGWQMLKAVPMHRDRRLSEITYLWQNTQAPERELIRVNVMETADWRAAQKHLSEVLHHCMRPDLPRGTGKLAMLGDIEFVARGPRSDLPAAVQFVRGNIVISVNSVGSVTIDVSNMAGIVDRVLTEPPTSIPFLRKQAKLQLPKTVIAKRKGALALVKDLMKVGDRWLKVITPDGELRRQGDSLMYITPEPGTKRIQIFSILIGRPGIRRNP
jgi:hypothetical protein